MRQIDIGDTSTLALQAQPILVAEGDARQIIVVRLDPAGLYNPKPRLMARDFDAVFAPEFAQLGPQNPRVGLDLKPARAAVLPYAHLGKFGQHADDRGAIRPSGLVIAQELLLLTRQCYGADGVTLGRRDVHAAIGWRRAQIRRNFQRRRLAALFVSWPVIAAEDAATAKQHRQRNRGNRARALSDYRNPRKGRNPARSSKGCGAACTHADHTPASFIDSRN